jgi:hypothetical protein
LEGDAMPERARVPRAEPPHVTDGPGQTTSERDAPAPGDPFTPTFIAKLQGPAGNAAAPRVMGAAGVLGAERLLALQAMVGNRSVARVVQEGAGAGHAADARGRYATVDSGYPHLLDHDSTHAPVAGEPGPGLRAQRQHSAEIEVEVLTQHDSYTDRSGGTVRVGDAHGPNVLMNIVDVPGGGVQLQWFNFKTGFAHTGSVADWSFLAMIDIAGTRDSEQFGRLGRSLSAAEWRRNWPNPVPEVLRRYEQGLPGVSDEVFIATYRGAIEQAAVARLAENEALINGLLEDTARVTRLEEYARGLKEAAIVRDRLLARKREVDQQLSISQQAPNIGLPKRQTMAGLDMPQRLRKLQEQSELNEAIGLWEAAFPLLTRLRTDAINAQGVEAVLKEIKANIVSTRSRLLKGDLDPWTLQAIRGATDPKLGTRARAAVAAEDKSRTHWQWFEAGASIVGGIVLLFLPGGIFLDAAIGVAMGASAWDDAAIAGRAANTGLHVDDGLMTQGQAAGARFAAVLATIGAVVGAAFAGLRVLRVGRAFAALGRALPELELAARARLARLLADEPSLLNQLIRIAEREQHVLPAVREAMSEFAADTFRLRQAIQAIAEGYKGPVRTAWMHGLHPDALAAVRRASPAELEEIAEMMRGSRNRADAQELLRQFTYKGLKAERKGGAAFEGVVDAAGKLRAGLKELAQVRTRGFPNGFPTLEAFKRFGQTVRDAVRRYGVDVSDIRVHGSALHSATPADIDVALIADAAKFDSLAAQFVEAARSAGHTKLASTIAKEAANGKIPYVRFAPREAGFEFGRVVRTAAGDRPVQVSLIKRGSEFDLGPYMVVP